MKNQRKTLAILFVLISAVCGKSWADPASDAPKAKATEAPATKLTRREIMEKLQLTADQKKQLQRARAAYRKQIAELDGQIKVKKVELENEIDKKAEANQEKIAVLTEEIGALYGKKLSVRVNASLDLEKNILTPQQSDLLKSLQSKDASSSDEIL